MRFPAFVLAAAAAFLVACGSSEGGNDLISDVGVDVGPAGDADGGRAGDLAVGDMVTDFLDKPDDRTPEDLGLDRGKDVAQSDVSDEGIGPDAASCPAGCDDQDECTTDFCDDAAGCVHEPIQGCCPGKKAFAEDFEGEDPLAGYSVDVPVPPYSDAPQLEPLTWQVADSRFHSPTHALYFGDPGKLNFDNGHRVASVVTTPQFLLEDGHDQSLTFWTWLDVESGPFSDHFTVYVESGDLLVPVWTRGDDFAMRVWTLVQVDLTPFSGQEIGLAFYFDSHDEHINGLEGVYIDDLTVEKSCALSAPCEAEFDCAGPGACATGACQDGACQWEPDADCCLRSSDCEDWDGCTIDKCKDNVCSWQDDLDPQCCNATTDCEDSGDECQSVVCKNHLCAMLPSGAPGCCEQDSQCDDQDNCTIDYCVQMQCVHIGSCCEQDSDCDDGDSLCTNDLCVNGTCKFLPTGAEGCCVDFPVDEDFEDGLAQGWSFDSSAPGALEWETGSADAYQGDKSLALEGSVGSEAMAEAVLPIGVIPPMGAKLTFWLKMDLPESGDCTENRLVVMFDNQVVSEWCNSLVNWFKVEVSLQAFAGQEGELSLRFEADPWLGGGDYAVLVDKVRLAQACCSTDSDCNDNNPCTNNVCPGVKSLCTFQPIAGCCLGNGQCQDEDPCTEDKCKNNECVNLDLCCESDAECDDGDDKCTADLCADGLCVFVPTGEAGCCEPELYLDGFEGAGGTDWDLDSDGNGFTWHMTDQKAATGDYSLYFGNNAGNDYGEDSFGTAASPWIELPAGGDATAGFQVWYDTEKNYDELLLQIVTEDGETASLAVYSGHSGDWESHEVDITAWSGQTVRFRFTFESDGSVGGAGVFVDNFKVDIACCSVNADCDDNSPCTVDSCPGEESLCAFVPITGCCTKDSQCDDDIPCTVDKCKELECQHIDVCCQSDADCDDGDDVCTQDMCIADLCYFIANGAPDCCAPDVFEEGFEQGQGDWVFENEEAAFGWHLNDAQAAQGEMALYYGNPEATSYGTSNEGTALSPPIELPSALEVSMSVALWLDTEGGFDELFIHVVRDNSEVQLGEFSGGDGLWETEELDLSSFAGETIRLRFSFDSDGSVSGTGVFVDSIVITKQCCQDDQECDDGNVCTTDSCPGVEADCAFVPVAGCCVTNVDCNDLDPCTQDVCQDNQCVYTDICCLEDAECDDGDDVCTEDSCENGFCQFLFQELPGCCQSDFFHDSFEGGTLAAYEVNNEQSGSGWHLTDAQSNDGAWSLSFSNPEGTSYTSSADGTIKSPIIPVPAFTKAPVLRFWTRYETESCCDKWRVSVEHDGQIVQLQELAGEAWEWQLMEYDVSGYIGQEIRVVFSFHSDGSLNKQGVFIDDLRVGQDCCQADDMCDDGNLCTTDHCPGVNSYCIFTPVEGCCLADAECDDGDECTTDDCLDLQCKFIPLCCQEDADCDDDNDMCTADSCVQGKCVYELLDESGCCVAELFDAGFDQGTLADWTVNNEDEDAGWQVSDAMAHLGAACLAYTNDDASTYGSNSEGQITSPPLDLAPLVVKPALSFWARYETEACCDKWSVFVVREGGADLLGEFGGSVDEWEHHQFDLSPYVGQTISVRFEFSSDGSVSKQGVFIDTLKVLQLGCCNENADCEDDNPCTVTSCPAQGAYCVVEAVPGCCQKLHDCDDGDPCTEESCIGHECHYVDLCCDVDEDCDDNDDTCTVDACDNGKCVFTPTNAAGCCTAALFFDNFSTDLGWSYGLEWEWGTATASECGFLMSDDPGVDHTDSGDNMLAGVVLGGCIAAVAHDYYYLTSPVIPSDGSEHLYLGYWRWLNSDYDPYVTNAVEVFNGQSWISVWTDEDSIFGSEDSEWTWMEHDISDLAGPLLQVRFGFKIGDPDIWDSPSWNIDDVVVFETNVEMCCEFDSDCEAFEMTCDGLMCE